MRPQWRGSSKTSATSSSRGWKCSRVISRLPRSTESPAPTPHGWRSRARSSGWRRRWTLRADDAVLAELAASVADGQSIDWAAAESSAAVPSRRLVRHLRLVDSIAMLYRSIPPEEQELIRARLDQGPATEPEGPRWGRLVLLERIGHGTSCEV